MRLRGRENILELCNEQAARCKEHMFNCKYRINLVNLVVIPYLKLCWTRLVGIITLCSTYGERKIWSNIKKSQNFMKIIVLVRNGLTWQSHLASVKNKLLPKTFAILNQNKNKQIFHTPLKEPIFYPKKKIIIPVWKNNEFSN